MSDTEERELTETEASRIAEIQQEIDDQVAATDVDLTQDEIVPRPPNSDIQNDCVAEARTCIDRNFVGYRVIQTQFNGQIMEKPIIQGQTRSFFDAATQIDEINRKEGSYAIRAMVYGCGHDDVQWTEFWNRVRVDEDVA